METTLKGVATLNIIPNVFARELDIYLQYAEDETESNVCTRIILDERAGKLYGSTSLDNLVIGVQYMPVNPLPQNKALSKKALASYKDFTGTLYITFRDSLGTVNTMALIDMRFDDKMISLYNRAFSNGITIGSKEPASMMVNLNEEINLSIALVELYDNSIKDMDGVPYLPVTIAMPVATDNRHQIIKNDATVDSDEMDSIYSAAIGDSLDTGCCTIPKIYAVTKTKTLEVQQGDLTMEDKDV